MVENDAEGIYREYNINHLKILQKFMQISLDEGIFWNQWYVFKRLYPTNSED